MKKKFKFDQNEVVDLFLWLNYTVLKKTKRWIHFEHKKEKNVFKILKKTEYDLNELFETYSKYQYERGYNYGYSRGNEDIRDNAIRDRFYDFL